MAVSSGFKAVGPTLGAVTFAWSLTNGVAMPLDVHFTFFLCGLLAGGTALVAARSFGGGGPTHESRQRGLAAVQDEEGSSTSTRPE